MIDYASEIKSAVSMPDLCERYGIAVDRSGFAKCPFHADKKPSMKVYGGNRGWYCYVCNQGGSVIDFTMKYFALPFLDAEKKLNEDFGLHLPIGETLSDEVRREAERAAELRRLVQERNRKRREKLSKNYSIAYDRFALLDRAVTEFAPKGPLDDISPEYAFAVSHIDWARAELDLAESKLLEFERNRINT